MTATQVSAYVQTQVTNLADAKIKPLVQSINGELAAIRANEARKAELDKNSAECNKRIAEYQKLIGTAQTEVNELADKLAAATTVAVS